jgi:hypothetical protein
VVSGIGVSRPVGGEEGSVCEAPHPLATVPATAAAPTAKAARRGDRRVKVPRSYGFIGGVIVLQAVSD